MHKINRLFWGLLALAAVFLSGCGGSGADNPPEDVPETRNETPAETEPAPAETEPEAPEITFTGTDLEGNAVSSDIFSQSKLTVINVWATTCNPCLREMPGLGELAAAYDPEEVQIVGIIGDVLEGEDQTTAESLVEETGAAYPHLLLNESIYYALLTDVYATPTTFFLDKDGTVLNTVTGAKEKAVWEEIINGLLEAQ